MSGHIYADGQVVHGRYRIFNYLAEGGMQEVYRATDLSFGRPVALKTPKNQSAQKRFSRSAHMSARVNHPNIAKTLDYFEENGRSHLIEELIEGPDLGSVFKTTLEYCDPHLAAHLIHHVAKGVAASHHAGVCHRDLKPSNILVSNDANFRDIRVTDFGIAKLAEEEIANNIHNDSSITGSKTLVGALPYMAPEVIENHRHANFEADVWALGAILHFLVTGQPPYGVGLSAVPKIVSAEPPQPPAIFATAKEFRPLTDELWEIVLRCLKKDPKARPTSDQLVEICSSLCYSSATRNIGAIVDFVWGAYGTIRAHDGTSVFFHTDSAYWHARVSVSQRVAFAPFPGTPKPRAFPVLPLKNN
jgi:serine/threonine-protein kinase